MDGKNRRPRVVVLCARALAHHHDGLISLATKLILKDNDLLSGMAPIICYGRQATVSVRAEPREGCVSEEWKKVTERVGAKKREKKEKKKTLDAIPSGFTP